MSDETGNGKPAKVEVVRRDSKGLFLPGTKGGPGNCYTDVTAKLKAAMFRAVKTGDVHRAIRRVVRIATSPNSSDADAINATRLLFDRLLGKPEALVKVTEDANTARGYTIPECVARMESLRIPEALWPPLLRQHKERERERQQQQPSLPVAAGGTNGKEPS